MNRQDAHMGLAKLFLGYVYTSSINVVAELGVADQLRNGSLHIDEIAKQVGGNAAPLYRIMRLLSAQGVFHEEDGRHFSLTPMAELLRGDVPDFISCICGVYGRSRL